jgi:hypothetical protein
MIIKIAIFKVFLWLGTILFLCIAIPTIWQNLRLLTWDLLLCIGLALPCAAHLVAFLLGRIFGLTQGMPEQSQSNVEFRHEDFRPSIEW